METISFREPVEIIKYALRNLLSNMDDQTVRDIVSIEQYDALGVAEQDALTEMVERIVGRICEEIDSPSTLYTFSDGYVSVAALSISEPEARLAFQTWASSEFIHKDELANWEITKVGQVRAGGDAVALP